jgi:hypothetical protein
MKYPEFNRLLSCDISATVLNRLLEILNIELGEFINVTYGNSYEEQLREKNPMLNTSCIQYMKALIGTLQAIASKLERNISLSSEEKGFLLDLRSKINPWNAHMLCLDNNGVLEPIDCKEKKIQPSQQDLVFENRDGRRIPHGVELVQRLNYLQGQHGFKIGFASLNSVTEQVLLIYDIQQACKKQGVKFPEITFIAVQDSALPSQQYRLHNITDIDAVVAKIYQQGPDALLAEMGSSSSYSCLADPGALVVISYRPEADEETTKNGLRKAITWFFNLTQHEQKKCHILDDRVDMVEATLHDDFVGHITNEEKLHADVERICAAMDIQLPQSPLVEDMQVPHDEVSIMAPVNPPPKQPMQQQVIIPASTGAISDSKVVKEQVALPHTRAFIDSVPPAIDATNITSLCINVINSGRYALNNVKCNTTIGELKDKIRREYLAEWGFANPERWTLRIIFAGKIPNDNQTLQELHILGGTAVHLVVAEKKQTLAPEAKHFQLL